MEFDSASDSVIMRNKHTSTSRFHERTLALLGSEGVRQQRSAETLLHWAEKKAVCLPAAFLEWAKLDDGTLLRKYSNDDWFGFDEPELIVTPDGARGLRFKRSRAFFFREQCLRGTMAGEHVLLIQIKLAGSGV
jgi:hypothetical protein